MLCLFLLAWSLYVILLYSVMFGNSGRCRKVDNRYWLFNKLHYFGLQKRVVESEES